jgi:predicted RNA binding protein YcfA (HicA-like mRNA interferase family)
MTQRFPQLSAKSCVRAFEKLGFVFRRQEGSHAIYRHPTTKHIVSIPMHSGDLNRFLVFGLIKQSGFSREEFLQVL